MFLVNICFLRNVQGPSDPKERGSASLHLAIKCNCVEINFTEHTQPYPAP